MSRSCWALCQPSPCRAAFCACESAGQLAHCGTQCLSHYSFHPITQCFSIPDWPCSIPLPSGRPAVPPFLPPVLPSVLFGNVPIAKVLSRRRRTADRRAFTRHQSTRPYPPRSHIRFTRPGSHSPRLQHRSLRLLRRCHTTPLAPPPRLTNDRRAQWCLVQCRDRGRDRAADLRPIPEACRVMVGVSAPASGKSSMPACTARTLPL